MGRDVWCSPSIPRKSSVRAIVPQPEDGPTTEVERVCVLQRKEAKHPHSRVSHLHLMSTTMSKVAAEREILDGDAPTIRAQRGRGNENDLHILGGPCYMDCKHIGCA